MTTRKKIDGAEEKINERLRSVAGALGRLIAREHFKASSAANDNLPPGHDRDVA